MPDTLTTDQIAEFDQNGFLRVDDLLSAAEVERYAQLYDHFLAGHIASGTLRFDLDAHNTTPEEPPQIENITQIMWPSALILVLQDTVLDHRCLGIARQLCGDDMAFDFDMLIDKAPRTNTSTPWHQDMAYWPDLPDTRSVSVWVALDEATIDNGCMWHVPVAHKQPLHPHLKAATATTP